MSRIEKTFARLNAAGQKALIPYITAGDPNPGMTVGMMHALVAGGADILELGVPFSDPMADGPVIQLANERALKFGTSLKDVLGMVAEFRKTNTETPVVLMGYTNPVECMGYEVFAKAAVAAGLDGLLLVDIPAEEGDDYAALMKQHGLATVFLIAPTTTDARLAKIGSLCGGYVYYVSLKGVTGAGNLDVAAIEDRLKVLRRYIHIPIGVGFGIRDGATATAVAQVSDAVVIGSRLVQEVEKGEAGLCERLNEFLSGVRAAMNTARA